MKKISLYFSLFSLLSCSKQTFTACDQSSIYSHTTFPVGVAVDVSELKTNSQYRSVVINQFNSITAENAFKFLHVQPDINRYDWEETDYLVNFAKQYNKRLHGHTLVWHSQLPPWIYGFTGNWKELLRDHITQEVGRYKQDIFSWDVVNEAFNEDGTLRSTIWLDHLGVDYIRLAFEFAHTANPEAKLFYNDYNLESNPAKLKGVIDFLTHLKASGIQIDGIGMQMHITNTFPSINQVAEASKTIADAGFLVHFSEMDVYMNTADGKTSLSKSELQEQANRYASVFTTYSQLNEKNQFGITIWGVSDADSWIPAGLPLLFDYSYEQKPLYCACKSLK